MYIMCVCLFSALSRRVGVLQISIIIIIIVHPEIHFSYYFHPEVHTLSEIFHPRNPRPMPHVLGPLHSFHDR